MAYNNEKLSIIMLNCRSLNNKLGEIKLMLYTKKPDLLCLTETQVKKYEPKFINYTPLWKHRPEQGGGLAILVRRGLQHTNLPLNVYRNGFIEAQAITLIMNKNIQVNIMNTYNPNKPVTTNEMQHYVNQLGNKFIIVGDLNARTPILNSRIQNKDKNQAGRMLEDILTNNSICLANPINFYTYLCPTNGTRSCLDICLTSPNLTPDIEMIQLGDVGSDHTPIQINTQLQPIRLKTKNRQKWIINKAREIENFRNLIKTTSLNETNNINEMWEYRH